MQPSSYAEITESHLAKKYNDVLYDCMMRCNVAGYMMEAEPHFDNLSAYFAATYILYRNTFMLFYKIFLGPDDKKESLAKILMTKMLWIRAAMQRMKKDIHYRNPGFFETIAEECDSVHMLIMDGLQRRHMLVRVGEAEPRGEDSVFYWQHKTAFKKGAIQHITNQRTNMVDPKTVDTSFFEGMQH